MTLAADTAAGSGLRCCGCCGRHLPAGRVAELGVTFVLTDPDGNQVRIGSPRP
ncbi:hypothetical protein [Micromonospora inyonensis]|uniref:Uncharacterized protein n=1 Tax=Micromonospora inyonensis TaxID=47866 RepID=A0A1C6SIP7_9ACTN|nr:hypothetical protein [Micromonospora inyonensis]SCL29235.1 hypothetical protein GA0074694_5340 [Micromonospora inyonensis]